VNAVEIEEAISELARQPFNAAEFPYAFLQAFGRKDVELKRLRKNNTSDVAGGVLRRDSIHMAVAAPGEARAALSALRGSPKSSANRVKFLFATDGEEVQAEETATGDFRSFPLTELDRHFGLFLPLAGISAVRQIKDNPIDVRAVGRLNKLYLELLRENPDWEEEAKRPELNRLMARLVFCFFAEDTGIFPGQSLFTSTVRQFSEDRSGVTNTDQVLAQLFLAMATPTQHDGKPDARYRQVASVKGYADVFPYVNGGLFSDAGEVPRFTRAARNYLLHAGELDWKEINPDIFGSMIQAVADDAERGSLGMHYTSVPNILKVLNPLFLDGLNEALTEAGDSLRKLRALRRRLGRIRVFDPACGSGNFLVIAYRQMRDIEHEIVKRTGDDPKSVIPLTNFYGIEIKGFAAEIARLALLIAEFQADARLISQQVARSMVLPLHRTGQIRVGNSLREDWLDVCPPAAPGVEEWDLGGPTGRLALEQSGVGGALEAETYICGNPPYMGGKKLNASQKEDMALVFEGDDSHRNLDYVCGFVMKMCRYLRPGDMGALVTTNSINQGTHVPNLWPKLFQLNVELGFAYEPFKWSNSAQNNAGVSCTILGFRKNDCSPKVIYEEDSMRQVANISPYIVASPNIIVAPASSRQDDLSPMITGNAAYDGGNLFLTAQEARDLVANYPELAAKIRPITGTSEFIDGILRFCLWFEDDDLPFAQTHPATSCRIERVLAARQGGGEVAATLLKRPHQFRYRNQCLQHQILIPQVSSERREYLPVGYLDHSYVISHLAHAIYDGSLVDFSILSSKIHLVWISTVCGRLETRLRYASNIGWNAFPAPHLTAQDKIDLSRCSEDILLAREAHFPATIAELYDPEDMPADLRHAHERNDETLERIYIGRRFRNDTERLEHLFALYTKTTASDAGPRNKGVSKQGRRARSPEKAA
jgi:hypothetical protein